jgi:hypothetical protein
MLPALLGSCYQHFFHFNGQHHKKTAQQILVCVLPRPTGQQRRKSTKQTDRKKALRVAEQYEQVSQRKLPVRTVRETLVELFREAYGESVPRATVREFIAVWLKNKAPEVAPATLDFYRKSTTKFIRFLGPAVELDLANVTRPTIVEFRNGLAQKVSAKTANHDLRAIKTLFRSAKRDGYIIEDPAEFVESVRKTGEDSRRPVHDSRDPERLRSGGSGMEKPDLIRALYRPAP